MNKWETVSKVSRNKANKKDIENIMNSLDKLFDIITCNCIIYLCNDEKIDCTGCSLGAHIFCKCQHDQKVPKLELQWLYCQRQKMGEKSSLQMSVNYSKESKRKRTGIKRKMEDLKRQLKSQKISEDSVILEGSSESSASSNISAENKPSSTVMPQCGGFSKKVEKWRH